MIGSLKQLGKAMRGEVTIVTDQYVTLAFHVKESGNTKRIIGHAKVERKYLDHPVIGDKFYLLEIENGLKKRSHGPGKRKS